MSTTSYAVGYTGYAIIGTAKVFATGGSVTINLNPMYSSGVWGAKGTEVTSKYAYAAGIATLDASVSFQLTSGAKTALATFASARAESGAKAAGDSGGSKVAIYPTSDGGYSGSGDCTSLSMNASLDSLVTGDVGIKAYVGSTSSGPGDGTLDTELIAYYMTSASIDLISGDCLGWSASYSSEVNFVKLMKTTSTTTTSTTITPDYILYGNMQGSGTVSLIGSDADAHTGTVVVSGYFSCPRAIIETQSMSIQTGANLAQTDYNFSALVDTVGRGAPITFSGSSPSN